MTAVDRLTKKSASLTVSGGALNVRSAGIMSAGRRFLTTDNTAAGPREMNVAGALGTPVRFRVGPPPGEVWGLTQVVSAVSDNATFNQEDFGGISGGLVNGINSVIRTSGVDTNLFGGLLLKKNYDWLALPSRVELTTWAGTAQTLCADFPTYANTGQYTLLSGDLGQELVVIVQDNLTSLIAFRTMVRYVVVQP